MDLMRKLGGRKFVITLMLAGLAAIIESHKEAGISMAFAGLIGTIITTFCAANAFISKEHFKKDQSGTDLADTQGEVLASMDASQQSLSEVRSEVNQVKDTMAQIVNTMDVLQKRVLAVINRQ